MMLVIYRGLQNVFHIGDRAAIYIFIASSYTPWYAYSPPTERVDRQRKRLSRTVSEKAVISVAKISHPVYFAPPLTGFPLEWVSVLRIKN